MEGAYLFPPIFYLPALIAVLSLVRYLLNPYIHKFDWFIENSLRIAFACAIWGVVVTVLDYFVCKGRCYHTIIAVGPALLVWFSLFVRLGLEAPAVWFRGYLSLHSRLMKFLGSKKDHDK